MKYSIIAIGDELLAGQVVDTNSGAIARMLEPHGWELEQVMVISDDPDAILQAIDASFAKTRVVLTTGGLGPTKDDLTKQTLCRYFGGEMHRDEAVLDNVKRVVGARGLKLNELTAAQAIVPTSCRVIQNEVGTAPLMWFEKDGNTLVAMPGVPFETVTMMERAVIRQLTLHYPSADALERRVVMVHGMSESSIAEMLSDWEDSLPDYAHLAYLPKPGVVRLRIDGRHTDSSFLNSEMDRLHSELINLIPDGHLMATSDVTPEKALLDHLIMSNLSIATAESCTGGTIASRLTAIPGASAAVKGGVVAYSNQVKVSTLGVDPEMIERFGAVSEQVVSQMAAGALKRLEADVAIATSGIAGPDGGTPEKPVGTVWIAVASHKGIRAFVNKFPGSRDRVIDRTATTALLAALEAL